MDHDRSTGVFYRARRDLLDLASLEHLRRLRSMRQPKRDTAKLSGRPGDGGQPTNGGCVAGPDPAEGGTRSRRYPSWRNCTARDRRVDSYRWQDQLVHW